MSELPLNTTHDQPEPHEGSEHVSDEESSRVADLIPVTLPSSLVEAIVTRRLLLDFSEDFIAYWQNAISLAFTTQHIFNHVEMLNAKLLSMFCPNYKPPRDSMPDVSSSTTNDKIIESITGLTLIARPQNFRCDPMSESMRERWAWNKDHIRISFLKKVEKKLDNVVRGAGRLRREKQRQWTKVDTSTMGSELDRDDLFMWARMWKEGDSNELLALP